MKKRVFVLFLCIVFLSIVCSGCSSPVAAADNHALSGTWTVTMSSTASPAISNFSMNLSYDHTLSSAMATDIYTASGVSVTIDGVGTYSCTADVTPVLPSSGVNLTLAHFEGGVNSVMNLTGTVFGRTISGTYSGMFNLFSGAAGTFTGSW